MSYAVDFLIQQMLLGLPDKSLEQYIIELNIKYNGKRPTVDQFKTILRDNLKARYCQTLSEIFTGDVN